MDEMPRLRVDEGTDRVFEPFVAELHQFFLPDPR